MRCVLRFEDRGQGWAIREPGNRTTSPPQSTGSRGRKLAATPVHACQDTRRSLVRRGHGASSTCRQVRSGTTSANSSQSGAGSFSTWVAAPSLIGRLVNPDATYQGIDYADAERHFGYSMPDTTYYEGDRWPISDASVDVVSGTETLEHVPDPPAFLTEAFRCLKPGGQDPPDRPVRGPLALHSP